MDLGFSLISQQLAVPARTVPIGPDLKLLLVTIGIRQAASPTARAQALCLSDEEPSGDARIRLFAGLAPAGTVGNGRFAPDMDMLTGLRTLAPGYRPETNKQPR